MGKGKYGIVYGIGVNDMPFGWRVENDWNYRVYHLWHDMIKRCYSEKWHEKYPTYKNCYVCDRWLKLSNFVEDIVKIDGYEYWRDNPNQRISLDKDIKSNGQNKCYCLEECMFVSHADNTRQSNKTMSYEYMKDRTGENNPMYGVHRYGEKAPNLGSLIDRFDKQGNYVDTKYNFEYVQMGFNKSAISSCCKGRYKSTGGYVFKYHERG